MSSNGLHQGIALQVPPYAYAHPDDLLAAATSDVQPALLVALDNISDPRNLGAIIRSVAAFAGHGVLIPQRRSASVTAVAWRTSAGAAARVPVARATNLNSDTQGVGGRRRAGRRSRRRAATPPSTNSTAPARWCSSSARRARDSPGWSGRTATRWCPSRWPGRPSRSTPQSPPEWCSPRWPGSAVALNQRPQSQLAGSPRISSAATAQRQREGRSPPHFHGSARSHTVGKCSATPSRSASRQHLHDTKVVAGVGQRPQWLRSAAGRSHPSGSTPRAGHRRRAPSASQYCSM